MSCDASYMSRLSVPGPFLAPTHAVTVDGTVLHHHVRANFDAVPA